MTLTLTESAPGLAVLTIGPLTLRLHNVAWHDNARIIVAKATPADGKVWREVAAQWIADEGDL